MNIVRRTLPSRDAIVYILLVLVCVGVYLWQTRSADHTLKPHEQTEHHHQSLNKGMIANIGDYHIELVLETDGKIRAYILGKNEWETMPIEALELRGEVIFESETEAKTLIFKPDPQSKDARGASEFVSKLPSSDQMEVALIVINVPIGARLYRARFTPQPLVNVQVHQQAMPEGVAKGSDDEKRLYLTPGGKYTLKDIELNGSTIPSIKFKGIRAEHDMNPRKGDTICPITFTKSNPKFYWWINGQKYLFCCPPCIDEFVSKAKKDPKFLKHPSEFIKSEEKK